jgi:hypothetical protein
MVEAVEAVRERLLRATAALESSGIAYAVTGGNAVAAWVARIDRAAVRNTPDVDILLRRSDLDAATVAMEKAGFVRRHIKNMEMFLDGPHARDRDSVHIIFAGEKVRPQDLLASPDVTEAVPEEAFQVLDLPSLVIMKLVSFRTKDRVHLRDMIDVELIDAGWVAKLPPELAARLQLILDTPDG